MKARSRGSSTASTMRTSPDANQACATFSTPCGVVRSPPHEHHPVPDDEHVAALDGRRPVRLVVVAVEHRRVGEQRVEAVDDTRVQALAAAGGHRHRVDRQPAVDPGDVVALEQVVRQRCQQEVVVAQALPQQARDGRPGDVGLEQAADQPLRKSRRRSALEHLAQRLVERRAEPGGRGEPVREERARPRHVERLGEQVGEEVDDDPPAPQQLGEPVVLLARPLRPQHVVEQQLRHVPRREALQLQARPVQHHLPQRAHLRVHAQRRGSAHPSSVAPARRRVTPARPTPSWTPRGDDSR